MLGRPITTIELIQINKFFSSGRGYKDLIRDFKKSFNVDLPKKVAKDFMMRRSWSDVLMWLTGEKIEPADDVIPANDYKHFELLEKMIKVNEEDNIERNKDLDEFEKDNYYIPPNVKYFNLPLFGQILTYKWREPYIVCFMFSAKLNEKRKLEKIEKIPVSDKLPSFLLRIIRKINQSLMLVDDNIDNHVGDVNYSHLIEKDDERFKDLKNIIDSQLFAKYDICIKE